MADSGYKSISRIDQSHKNNHGWYVRVTWKKQTSSKFFSDIGSGSKEVALQEAVAYRDQLERELGKPRSEQLVMAAVRASNTGVRGVRRITSKQEKDGRTYTWDVYQVTYHPAPGVQKRTSVSIQKYGEEEAFRKACEIRKHAEQQRLRSTTAPAQSKSPKRKKKPKTAAKQVVAVTPTRKVTFRLPAQYTPQAHTVHLVGEFNQWQIGATPMEKLGNGDFTVVISLKTGRSYQYRYVINQSEWLTDPIAESTVRNEYGDENAVITV